jgi:hypothetical protein
MITGRPSKYTEERAEQICSRIVEGESPRSICSAADMPDKATVFRWLARYPDFRDQYWAAKECLMITMMDEMLEIADDSSQDTLFTRDGRPYANEEWIARCRLRIRARRWLMSKLALKKYRRQAHP